MQATIEIDLNVEVERLDLLKREILVDSVRHQAGGFCSIEFARNGRLTTAFLLAIFFSPTPSRLSLRAFTFCQF